MINFLHNIWGYMTEFWNLHVLRRIGKYCVYIGMIAVLALALNASRWLLWPAIAFLVIGIVLVLISIFMEGSS